MLRNFNMVCILSDANKIDPNLTFRSSRTPSVCQYKHQSLVTSSSVFISHLTNFLPYSMFMYVAFEKEPARFETYGHSFILHLYNRSFRLVSSLQKLILYLKLDPQKVEFRLK